MVIWDLGLKTMMVHLSTAIIESVLTSSITTWYAAATAKDKGRLQCVIGSAEKVISCNLPSLQDLHGSRTLRRASKIVVDPSHPGHKLLEYLPSTAGGCGPLGPKPHATRTASFPRQLASRPGTPTDPHRFPPSIDTILHVILTFNSTDSHNPWALLCYINAH